MRWWEVYDQLSLTIAPLCTHTADLFSWSCHAQRFCIRNPQVIASFLDLLLLKSTVENLPKCKLISVFMAVISLKCLKISAVNNYFQLRSILPREKLNFDGVNVLMLLL